MIRRRDNGNGIKRREKALDEMPDDVFSRLTPDEIRDEYFDMKPDGVRYVMWHIMIRFADEYLKDKTPNAEYAYIRAGGQAKNAKIAGNALLKNPVVQELIAKKQLERRERTNFSLDRVLQELAALAFFNPQDMYDAEGNFIPLHQLPREVAAAISSMKAKVNKTDDGCLSTQTLEFRHWNKNQALELFMRHYGALNDKFQIDLNEQRTVTLRLQVDQLKETYSRDELRQLHRLLAKVPQAASAGADASGDGIPRNVHGGNGSGGNGAPGFH